jgi:thiamine kinase-like enzyme
MTGALPQNIQLRLEQTLAQWRHWHSEPQLETPPAIRAVLGLGLSNFSILVGSERNFVVRIDGISPAANGLNRQSEWRTLQEASNQGLAPTPRYFNPELGSLVSDYLPPDPDQSQEPEQVAELLRGIHQLPARHHRLDLGERVLRYEKQLAHCGEDLPPRLLELAPRLAEIQHKLSGQQEANVLCHNDLLRANRLSSGDRLWALDWEYCAMGSPWYDLSIVICEDGNDGAWGQRLLRAYLERAPSPHEQELVHTYGCIYRYLEILWYLAQQKNPPEETFLQRRTNALVDALTTGGVGT